MISTRKASKLKYYKKLIQTFIILTGLFLCSQNVLAEDFNFLTIEGEGFNNNEIVVKKSIGIYDYNISKDEFPRDLSWTWNGNGQAWLMVKYSDNNVIYYLMENSEVPRLENIKFIDSNGIPRIIKPVKLMVSEGNVNVDLIDSYNKYCGSKSVNVEQIQFYINTTDKIKINDFKIDGFQKVNDEISNKDLLLLEDEIYIEVQIPQGNKKQFYLIKDMVTPIEVSVKSIVDKKSDGFIRINIPEGMEILSTTNDDIEFLDEKTLILQVKANSGYYEEKIVFIAKANMTGQFSIETEIGENKKELTNSIANYEKEAIISNILLIDEGVYPVNNKNEIQKELKNNINIKQNITDFIHRTFGDDEDETLPAGYITGVIKNTSSYDIPVNIKYSVLNIDGDENLYFRGEHFLIESAVPPPVPETSIVLDANSATEFKLPVYADVYSVEPGIYNSELLVSFFGSKTELIVENFELQVYKDVAIQNFVVALSMVLALISFIVLLFKQKKWLNILKSKELMLISLFTTVKFAVVDIPYSVFGKVIRGVLAPLGPFTHLFTGIFSDLFDSLLIVTLVMLIPKPGVIIISKFIRIILGGIAFGSFNPVTIILSLSYALILEIFLYISGYTSGKKKFDTKFNVFLAMSVIFSIQQLYSTYTYYYVYMYLYRLFYPLWYINISAIFSVFYAVIGAIAGIYLGKKIEKGGGIVKSEFVEAELKQTLFNSFDIRVKFLLLFSLALMGIILDTWEALLVTYLLVIFMVIISRISIQKVKVLIVFTFLTVWGLMWLQAIFYDGFPKTKLFYVLPPMVVDPSTPIIGGLWKGLGFYYEGFIYGIIQSLRMLIPMTYGMLIFWTEEPIRILVGLNKLKLPYTISFMVMTCLRFIPITFAEARVTLNSQRLRKYKPFDLKGIIFLYGLYNTMIQTLVPLLANCIRKSVNMAKSVDSRAFRSSSQRTQLREIKMTIADKIVCIILIILVVSIILLELLDYLQTAGIYYNSSLLPFYWFAGKFI